MTELQHVNSYSNLPLPFKPLRQQSRQSISISSKGDVLHLHLTLDLLLQGQEMESEKKENEPQNVLLFTVWIRFM